MNQFQEYAAGLIKAQGLEKALAISEENLNISGGTPNTFLYDEAQWYLDKEGGLSLAKDQKKFAGLKEKRLKTTRNFWLQVTNLIRKAAKNAASTN